MAIIPSSNSSNFAPALSDLTLEAFSRIGVRPSALTPQHMFDARMSANLFLSEIATRDGPNLWKTQLLSIPLVQGTAQYPIPGNVIMILDSYIRQFNMGPPVNQAPSFATVLGSPLVTVNFPANGLGVGGYVAITIPVAIGGLILQGTYPAVGITSSSSFTINVGKNATATASGGVVPAFTTTQGSAAIAVTLPNHGLALGQNFAVQVQTNVGGLVLNGVYPVTTVSDANTFSITSPQLAGAGGTVSENGGLCQLSAQLPIPAQATDFYLTPFSRTEYAAQSNKAIQARPTTFWFNRLNPPNIVFWQVPDGNGPYTYFYYAWVQDQDAVMAGGVGLDIPFRFQDAFAAGLAARLARKYPPPMASGVSVADLKMEAEQAWKLAAKSDTENVPLYIVPGLGGYFS